MSVALLAAAQCRAVLRVKKGDQFRFLENCLPTPPQANINTYFSLRAKCWLRGGVGGYFPPKPKYLLTHSLLA